MADVNGAIGLDRFEPGWQERTSVEELPAIADRLAARAVELERAGQPESALRLMTEAVTARRRVVAEAADEQLLAGGAWEPLAMLLGHRRRLLRVTGRTAELGAIDDELAALHERLNRAIQVAAGLQVAPPPDPTPQLRELVAKRRADGDLAGAREAQEQLIAALAEAATPSEDLATEVGELANLIWELGDRPAARTTAEQAVALHDRAGEPKRPATVQNLTRLGSMCWQLGELPAAREALARAVYVAERAYGADHVEVGRCLAHLATVHYDLAEFAAARDAQQRALAILDQQLGPDHREALFVAHSLGRTLRQLGDRVAAHAAQQRALTGYQRALAEDRRRLGWQHPRVTRTLNRIREVRRELVLLAAGSRGRNEPAVTG
ncbi:MAG TPA: tetratricopeptide repeat protein [Natronosporangium sp.]